MGNCLFLSDWSNPVLSPPVLGILLAKRFVASCFAVIEKPHQLFGKLHSKRRVNSVARVTIEDCLKKVPNPFELSTLGAKRAHQLLKGAMPLVKADNREVIIALREIAAGKVRKASQEPKPR